MSDKGLSLLNRQNLLDGYKNQVLNFCECCAFGKKTTVKFGKKGAHRTKEKLNYIHSNLWGPNKISAKSGARYVMTLTITQEWYEYFMKTKDEAFSTFVKGKKIREANQMKS